MKDIIFWFAKPRRSVKYTDVSEELIAYFRVKNKQNASKKSRRQMELASTLRMASIRSSET
jgi:hypothetical protein